MELDDTIAQGGGIESRVQVGAILIINILVASPKPSAAWLLEVDSGVPHDCPSFSNGNYRLHCMNLVPVGTMNL